MKLNICPLLVWLSVFVSTTFFQEASAQAEFTTWGNLTGIRVDGQLMTFEGSLCVVNADWSRIRQTARERQEIRFSREGEKQIFTYRMDSLFFTETITNTGSGTATVEVTFTSKVDTTMAGAFFRLDLPAAFYADSKVQLIAPAELSLSETIPNGQNEYLRVPAGGVRFTSPYRQLEVMLNEPAEIIVKADPTQPNGVVQVYLTIATDSIKTGQTNSKTFTIKATGDIDKEPLELRVFPAHKGREFAGIGGNFRLQNPKADPQVIDYSLENLRVAWSRVEMPWGFWHPEENTDPIAAAKNGNLHERVKAAMEMAQRLDKMGIPVILSAWFPPEWAADGPIQFRPQGGVYGNALDSAKTDKIYQSIADYIQYLKDQYGVEIVMFSFNESDLGINVRQTPKEHAQLIKGLGAYLAARGLNTKLLLGDTADANGWPFTLATLEDPETYPYIGAVSFHSWRGYSDENLYRWHDIANRINVPLLVGEGSIDAGAWRYPAIFEEPTYALDEINLYTRILAICEPLSILQWQLTSDYSAMSGGGVFGNDEDPLYPTQRFWNLKQLGATPEGVFAMPITSNKKDVTAAALGNNDQNTFAIHLVNNGSNRQATLSGLPSGIKELHIYVTNQEKSMEEGKRIRVTNGKAQFMLEAASYTTLMSK